MNLTGGIDHTRIRNSWRSGETYEIDQEKYDWTRCPGQRWFLAAAKQRGVRTFIAFCNSPPKRLTVNGLTSVDPNANKLTNNLKPGMEHQYGAYLGDILQHFRDNPDSNERIDFAWVSPINEPQWDWTGGQEGTRASDDDITRQYKAIYTELTARHLTTRILGPESGSIPDMYQLDHSAGDKHKADYGDYVDRLAQDGELLNAMDHHIGYHSYWSDDPNQIVADRQKLRARLDRYPQCQPIETEYCVMEPRRDLGIATALRAMRVLHADLTIVNSTGWSWWLAVSNGNYKDGLIFTDFHRSGDDENVLPSKLLWAYGHYARFIRPGMIRVQLNSTGAQHSINGVMGSAYLDPETGKTIAVYINTKDDAVMLQLKTTDAVQSEWTPYITSDKPGDDIRKYPTVRGDITLPGKSVVTLVESAK
jgi:hypothetical protein